MPIQLQFRSFLRDSKGFFLASKFSKFLSFTQNESLVIISRNVNTQTLVDLEITPKQREEYLGKIVLEDYSEGPIENDQYGTEPMWVFGKIINAKEIYIKITITELNVVCISFHTSQYPMNYPFK
ncbi:hypothetical protein [Chryseobacterium koreense]